MSFLDKFLTNQTVDAPVEMEFPSTGFIGQVSAKVLYQVQTMLDLQGPEFRDEAPQAYAREQRSDGMYIYYYVDRSAAEVAAQIDDEAFAPQLVWYFSMPISSVLNVDTSKFTSQAINRSLPVTTLRAKKNRHAFHMIALPAIVAAAAKVNGYDVPAVDFGPLAINNPIIPDEVSVELIGNGDNYTESKLWRQRAEIWAALGEPEPRKYLVGSTDRFGNPHKDCTTAQKLIDCLALYHRAWSGPMWVRMVNIADPRIGAVTKNGNRLTIPAVMEIFEDQAAAQAATDKDLKAQAKGNVEPAMERAMPPAPSGWEEAEGDWLDIVAPYAALPKAKARTVYAEAKGEEEYGVSFDELWRWVEFLKAK